MTDPIDEPADPELTGFLHRAMPFTAALGAEALAATAAEVRTRVAWDPSRCTAGVILHGGPLMALADATGGWCAFLHVPEGGTTTTIEAKTNFLRAVRSGHVTATARPLHAGRTTVVVDTELRDDEGRLVARTTQTQAVVGPDRVIVTRGPTSTSLSATKRLAAVDADRTAAAR